jgi:hypothetical protein
MRRAQRRLHLLMWIAAAAAVAVTGWAAMTLPVPDRTETFRPGTIAGEEGR